MKLPLLLIFLLALQGCADSTAPRVEFRFASSDGSIGQTRERCLSTGDYIYVENRAVFTEHDLAYAILLTEGKAVPTIGLTARDSAQIKILDATTKSAGYLLAIVVDGHPEIALPISGGFGKYFEISGFRSKDRCLEVFRIFKQSIGTMKDKE